MCASLRSAAAGAGPENNPLFLVGIPNSLGRPGVSSRCVVPKDLNVLLGRPTNQVLGRGMTDEKLAVRRAGPTTGPEEVPVLSGPFQAKDRASACH